MNSRALIRPAELSQKLGRQRSLSSGGALLERPLAAPSAR
jgi:hypothetical protein